MSKIKIIFVGTPDFGAPSLIALINDDRFEIISVITQVDKKVGRKQILTPPPIKKIAEAHNIPVLQPEKISTIVIDIKNLNPDLMVVIAYAQILPESILNIPKFGCINVHGSLLPKYRGAACIQASILNGDAETGVTIIKMDKTLDTGAILNAEKIQIQDDDTTGILFNKLSQLAPKLLIKTILDYTEGKINLTDQDNSLSSYVGQLSKKDGEIDFNKTATELERFVRAMTPWPGAFFYLNEKTFKLIKISNTIISINNEKPGTLFIHDKKLCLQCSKDAIIVENIQPEGKKVMSADEFICGYKQLIKE